MQPTQPTPAPDKTQTTTTFFLLDRRVLGAVWIAKRIMVALTIGSAIDQNILLVLIAAGIREGLSALTDFSQPLNPVVTTGQSSPPNPIPEPITDPAKPTDPV